MTKDEYAQKLLDPRWQKKRLLILNRDRWTCTRCKRTDLTLHVHHEAYIDDPWDIKDEYLRTLCYKCHKLIHLELSTKINIKEMKDIPKQATVSEYLQIRRFSNARENPKGLPQHILNMWKCTMKFHSMSEPEYIIHIKNNSVQISKDEWIHRQHCDINKECFKWSLVLIDDTDERGDSYYGIGDKEYSDYTEQSF